ncbi:LacI family DNA-binding transcriptional regulator [Pseudonocardia xishanensis]|uniref:LacI family DNA-binding transcriptional regulator n=1 Tax=Pseudonocardia xishanensis TaxID=630995 RepID=A0ABP8RXW0_9PSEU
MARLAGVAPSTVSRSLTGTSYVAADTRERIRRAAAELAYAPTERPRRPAAPHAVAALARFPSAWFFAEAVGGVERVLRAGGYQVVLHNVGDPAARADLPGDDWGLAGLIVVASSFTDAERARLLELRVPVTVVGGSWPGMPRVGIDDRAGAATAVRHLIGLGHTEIALLGFDPDDGVGREVTEARTRGYVDALTDAGLEVRPEWMVALGDDAVAGARAVELLLGGARLPTAVFAMSDEMALGALRTLRRAGVDVPGRMSVIGFDDQAVAEYADLTTIAQPAREQGECAAALLLEAVDDTLDGTPDIDLPTRLVVRGTTGPPPR